MGDFETYHIDMHSNNSVTVKMFYDEWITPEPYLDVPFKVIVRGHAWNTADSLRGLVVVVMPEGQNPYSVLSLVGDGVCGELENANNSVDCNL